MVIDFSVIKNVIKEKLDHKNLNDILPFNPTAENMAKYFYEKIRILGYNMKAVTVYETPVNSATYME